MKRLKKALLPLLLCLCIFLAGCTAPNSDGNPADGRKKTVDAKGTLNISSYTPDSLNPLTTQFSCVRDFLYLAYEGLFIVNEDLTPKGVLATDYRASDGNTVFKINLKEKVRFHDGSRFTSEDVIATFDYIRFYSDYYKDALSNVESYRADGDYGVIIKLKKPSANFVCNLDFPIMPSGINASSFKNYEINGTGRYKHSETVPYKSLTLTKNEKWHKEDEVYIKDVCVRFLNSNEAMLYAFDSGETDVITTDRGRWGEFSYTVNYTAYEVTSTGYMFLGLNSTNSVFSDVKLRQSLAALIDKQILVDTVMFSHANIADTPISAKAAFYRNDNSGVEYDKEYIKTKEFSTYILFNEEDNTKRLVALNVQKALEEAGIKAELTSVDYETYLARIRAGDYGIYVGKIDIKRDCDLGFMFESAAPVVSAPGTDEIVVEVGEVLSVLPHNVSGICDFADPKLDDIIENINSAKNDDVLKTAYNNLKNFYDENLPQIPLFHINEAMLVNSRLKGKIRPNLTNFYADLGTLKTE